MALPKEIKEKLGKCPLEIQVFVKALQAENTKLATKNGNLTAKNITCRTTITELKNCLKKQTTELAKISKEPVIFKVVYGNHKKFSKKV